MKKITILFFAFMMSVLSWHGNAQTMTITHSSSQDIVPGSAACPGDVDNSFFRDFNLPSDFGITDGFTVSSVEFGVEEAGAVSLTLNIYSTSTTFPTGFPGSLTLEGTANYNVTAADNLSVVSVPLAAIIPAGATMVFELKRNVGGGNAFYPGSNPLEETGTSWIMAAGCGLATPASVASVDFPDMHLVMNVVGMGEVTPCSGMPDAGIVMINPASGNPGSSYNVSAEGYMVASGMLYQWQSNTNGAGWVDEGVATSGYSAYSATAPSEIGDVVEWRLSSTCTSSSETAISPVATFTTVLAYCNVLFPSNVEPITYVNFAGIENTTSAATGGAPLEDFTAQTASVNLGESYSIEIKGNTDGAFTTKIVAYIDWNQDGVFDDATGSNEMYLLPDIYNSNGEDATSSTGSIAVPASALLGNTRMRVMKKFNSIPTPCNTAGYGQAEDYTVEVSDATASINDNSLLTGASLYPNPLNSNTLYVNTPQLNGENIEVKISDLAGRQIFNNTLIVKDNKVTVSVSDDLTSGMYLVTLKHAGAAHTLRLVKK